MMEQVTVTGSGGLNIDAGVERKMDFADKEDKSVRVWSLESFELLHTFRGHKLPVLEVTLNGDITSKGNEF